MVPRKWLDELWRRPSVGYVVALVGFAVFLYWIWRLPAPGYAVTAMGAAVAVMSLRIEPRALERAAWVVLIFGLLAIEIRAIHHDRTENQTQQAAQRTKEEEHFSMIGRDINAQIQQSGAQFAATMSKTNALIAQSKKNMAGGPHLPDFGKCGVFQSLSVNEADLESLQPWLKPQSRRRIRSLA